MFLLNRYWFLHSDISNLYFKNEVKIIKYTKGLIFSLFLLSTFILGCKDKGAETVIEPPKLESLGLEGKIVNKLDYVEPYLYVSAASEGLLRRNVLSLT